ncbi:hypothetical protein C7S16_5126 [Burkholderia thailandensis]|uniref:Uncharacterized protein n=1 Tax=Burkholderia thailandensis TaxID=57975 RepID=A0AAW9CJ84_BURTH|nr:hypothetical protein [Burkholderia thailandensis]MDW9251020.1 hypothetical protein [Burkholderia thailandensis]
MSALYGLPSGDACFFSERTNFHDISGFPAANFFAKYLQLFHFQLINT